MSRWIFIHRFTDSKQLLDLRFDNPPNNICVMNGIARVSGQLSPCQQLLTRWLNHLAISPLLGDTESVLTMIQPYADSSTMCRQHYMEQLHFLDFNHWYSMTKCCPTCLRIGWIET